MKGSVFVVGSFNIDHVWTTTRLPQPGETLSGAYHSGPGGKGFNQAIAARRAGAETIFICALGQDAGGQLAQSMTIEEGIDLRKMRSTQPTGSAGIYVDASGRNSIVLGPGANHALNADFVRHQHAAIQAASVVLAQLETTIEVAQTALEIGRTANAVTLLNPAPVNAESTTALLSLADVLTPNATEFAALVARHLGDRLEADAVATLAGDQLHGLCRKLLPQGTVVITLGASGCFVSHAAEVLRGDSQAHYRIAAEQAHVVDTTGAGDAFNGALAASLAAHDKLPFATHIQFASRYAAISTERPGAALAMPKLSEVATRFADPWLPRD